MVVRKGRADAVGDGRQVVTCDEEGSPRRAGGQVRGSGAGCVCSVAHAGCAAAPCALHGTPLAPVGGRAWCTARLPCKTHPGRAALPQGDVLSGCIAAYAAWAQRAAGASREQLHEGGAGSSSGGSPGLPPLVVAAYAGCLTTRRASQRAFARQRRSMGATDLLAELGAVADELAEQGSS